MTRAHAGALLLSAGIAAVSWALGPKVFIITTPVALSIMMLGTKTDFESLAKKFTGSGHLAKASASIVGGSGVKHTFAFMISKTDGAIDLVSDAALSVSDVDETKVLGFYAKVYDVKPEKAVLCVSPRLNPAAAELARQYGIVVIENEKPADLVPMLSGAVDKILKAS